jgi:carbonic anhydrase
MREFFMKPNKITIGAALLAILLADPLAASEWNYNLSDEHAGPGAWGTLEGNEACHGSAQSPIDLGSAQEGHLPKLQINYKRTDLAVVNNGHTIQVNISNGSTLKINGKSYTLLQFHFHSPSEHGVNGYRYPMEAHFVNKAADGSLAVIGVFIKEGKVNPTLQKIWDIAPEHEGEASADIRINPSKLLGDEENVYYGYHGSLTTPPCSEIVTWNVLDETISASREQIEHFVSLLHDGHNARPIQPVNGRTVSNNDD